MKRITIVKGDDWEAIYVDGVIKDENHRLTTKNILDVVGIEFETYYPDEEWLYERGCLPQFLEDVKFSD